MESKGRGNQGEAIPAARRDEREEVEQERAKERADRQAEEAEQGEQGAEQAGVFAIRFEKMAMNLQWQRGRLLPGEPCDSHQQQRPIFGLA